MRLLSAFLANSMQQQLEYRADFMLNLLNVALSTLASLTILLVMFTHRRAIGGWSFAEVLVLIGVFRMFKGYVDVVLFPNLGGIPRLVRRGELDFVLLKPVDSRFYVSWRRFDFWRLPEALVGVVLIAIGWNMQGIGFEPGRIGLALALVVIGAAVLHAVWLLLMTTSFWFTDIANLPAIPNIAFEFAQFPTSAFPGPLKFALTFIFPIAFITTVPAASMVGRLQWTAVLQAIIVAALLLAASRLFWSYALRRYTSASS